MDKNWISATATHNYFTEPLLDWFKYTQPVKKNNGGSFTSYLMTQGNMFEEKIVQLILKKMGKNTINIDGNLHARDKGKVKETFDAMKKGYYVIFSGVLHNAKNKTFGVPDLLIRSDVVDKLITHPILDIDEEVINAPKLGKQKWHYCVIDIKYMTLMLKSDGETLLNSGHIPAYKAQLCVYNEALGEMQGYLPPQAYLLGRRWVYQKCGQTYYNDHCFDKLGIIDYEEKDEKYVELTGEALKWIKACKTPAAKKWNVTKYPLTRKELYPNMCNMQESRWKTKKILIAKQNHELTELWHVGKKNRFLALQRGINNWKDPKCTASVLGINGKTGKILDEIIDINQGKKLFKPTIIQNNLYEWKDKQDEYFVDFEFRNSVFDPLIKLPISDTSVLLFMIGVGYMNQGKWVFKHFTADHLTEPCEKQIAKDFLKFLGNKRAKLWHWSQAEVTMWENVMLKHPKIRQMYKCNPFDWCDLLKVFQEEPIVIKGCLNFKLKSVATAMHQHGFIHTIWPENGLMDGQTAMIHTINADKNKKPLPKQPIIQSVIQYNEIDVKVLQEMLYYIRLLNKPKTLKRKIDQVDTPAMRTRSRR